MRSLLAVSLLLLSLPLVAHPGHGHDAELESQPEVLNPGMIPDARSYFTDTVLIDQHGQERRFYSDLLENRVVLLNVIFTRCEDACPVITSKLKQVRRQLGERAEGIDFISLSSDPQNDTPQDLKVYAKKHGVEDANWHFMTGDPADMTRLLGRLGQFTGSVENHSTLLIAGDVANKRWSKIRPDAPVTAIVERLVLLHQPPAAARTCAPDSAPC
ncbi:SCO family protein [Pseudomonas sp. WN033]|nr:SCO family protein [Pseudomonas sp. WN033]